MSETDFFGISVVEGKGLGAIATKDIKAGTVLLKERAVLVVPGAEVGLRDICAVENSADARLYYKCALPLALAKFEALSTDLQQQVAALHDCYAEPETAPLMIGLAARKAQQSEEAMRKIFMNSTGNELLGAKSVAGILETNRIPLGEQNATGIFPVISRFNHSCVPNALYQCRDDVSGANVVVTLRDVQAGEEICVQYFKHMFMTQKERYQRTFASWGFKCMCEACGALSPTLLALGGTEEAMTDERLERLMKASAAPLEEMEQSCLRREMLWKLNQEMERTMSLPQGMRILEKMRELYSKEKLLPNLQTEMGLLYDELSLVTVFGGPQDSEQARKVTRKLFSLACLAKGAQHKETLKYRAWTKSDLGAPTHEQLYEGSQFSPGAAMQGCAQQ